MGTKKENVKLATVVVDRVRKIKETTGISIGRFFEIAVEEKISKLPKKLKN